MSRRRALVDQSFFQPQQQLLIKAPSPLVVLNNILDIGVNAAFEELSEAVI